MHEPKVCVKEMLGNKGCAHGIAHYNALLSRFKGKIPHKQGISISQEWKGSLPSELEIQMNMILSAAFSPVPFAKEIVKI